MKENLYILLLEKEAANELSASEKTDLQNWLVASEENRETAKAYRQILDSGSNYSQPIEVNLNARFAELESKIGTPEAKVRKMKSKFNWWRVAATFALLIGGYFIFRNAEPVELQWVEVEIAKGDSETFTFSDGSKMTLRGGSKIEYPEEFLGFDRRVKLTGEAFFEVVKNPSKKFVVEFENGEVRVLGTSFNIKSNTDSGSAAVYVKTGTVQFSTFSEGKNDQVILKRSESGIFNKKENSLKKRTSENENEISWMTRKLNFKSTPLNDVLKNISDLYGSEIRIEKPEMMNCPIDLSFENEDLKSVLETISSVFGMEVAADGKNFLLKGGNCN